MNLRDILEKLYRNEINVEEAIKLIRLDYIKQIEDAVRFDVSRGMRRDVPEIILGSGKSPDILVKIIKETIKEAGLLIVSRLNEEQERVIKEDFLSDTNMDLYINPKGRIAIIKLKEYKLEKIPCKVGIITAGTADIKVAEEAKTIVEVMGCKTVTIYDVGIAGMHRVLYAVKKIKEEDVDVAIIIAGMEGALPSVIASLLDIPIIGVPTSVGYGEGGEGKAALLSMLQACPLGLAVVNIDNGINAGIIAGLIGKKLAILRMK